MDPLVGLGMLALALLCLLALILRAVLEARRLPRVTRWRRDVPEGPP